MFVSYDEWSRMDLFHPDDAYMKDRQNDWYEYYRCKWYYAELSRAKSILEIGVRLGYSAYAFMSSLHCESYTGWDIQEPIDGGMDFDTFPWVEEKIFSKFPRVKASLKVMNTQKDDWGIEKFDLIHVDGDHSFAGTLSDCVKAYGILNDGGLMVVDDYIFIDSVKKAIDVFIDEKDLIKIVGYSKRGDALIWKIQE